MENSENLDIKIKKKYNLLIDWIRRRGTDCGVVEDVFE